MCCPGNAVKADMPGSAGLWLVSALLQWLNPGTWLHQMPQQALQMPCIESSYADEHEFVLEPVCRGQHQGKSTCFQQRQPLLLQSGQQLVYPGSARQPAAAQKVVIRHKACSAGLVPKLHLQVGYPNPAILVVEDSLPPVQVMIGYLVHKSSHRSGGAKSETE